MKFRYLIINFEDGSVQGTNNKEVVENFQDSEEHLVLDPTFNHILGEGGELEDIEEIGD